MREAVREGPLSPRGPCQTCTQAGPSERAARGGGHLGPAGFPAAAGDTAVLHGSDGVCQDDGCGTVTVTHGAQLGRNNRHFREVGARALWWPEGQSPSDG